MPGIIDMTCPTGPIFWMLASCSYRMRMLKLPLLMLSMSSSFCWSSGTASYNKARAHIHWKGYGFNVVWESYRHISVLPISLIPAIWWGRTLVLRHAQLNLQLKITVAFSPGLHWYVAKQNDCNRVFTGFCHNYSVENTLQVVFQEFGRIYATNRLCFWHAAPVQEAIETDGLWLGFAKKITLNGGCSNLYLNFVNKGAPVTLSKNAPNKCLGVEFFKFVHVLSCTNERNGTFGCCHSSQSSSTLGMPIHLSHDHTSYLQKSIASGQILI